MQKVLSYQKIKIIFNLHILEPLNIFKFFIFLDVLNYVKYVLLLINHIFCFQIRQTAESDKYLAIKRLLQVGCTKGPFCSAKRPRRKVIATVYVFGRSKDMSDMKSAFFNVHSCFFGWCEKGAAKKKIQSKSIQINLHHISPLLFAFFKVSIRNNFPKIGSFSSKD